MKSFANKFAFKRKSFLHQFSSYCLIAAVLLISQATTAKTTGTAANDEQPGIAILLDFQNLEEKYQKEVFQGLFTRLQKSENSHFQFYDYNEDKGELSFRKEESTGSAKPCEKIVFLRSKLHSIENPELVFKRDTAGKVISAHYAPEFHYRIECKIIDIASSKIESMELITPRENKTLKKEIKVRDVMQSLKKDPMVLKRTKPDEYQEQLVAIRKKYQRDIDSFYKKCVKDAAREVGSLASPIKALRDKRLFKIKGDGQKLAEGKKKLKEFEINAGLDDDLADGDYMEVVCKRKYGEWEIVEKLDRSIVKEEGRTSSICKPYLFSGKKMTEALLKGEEVFFVRNEVLLKSLNNEKAEKQTATVDKTCLFCAFEIEQKIVKLSNVELIERQHEKVLLHFVELGKNDQFLDFDLASIQGRQKGVRYIVNIEENKIKATDVQTGKLFVETPKTNKDGAFMKMVKNNLGVSNSMIARLFLDLLEEEVSFIQVVEQKKNKVKLVLAHHPVGFVRNERMRIYSVSEEDVKGKKIERKEEIGVAIVKDLKSDNIAELSVYKGKKEIAEAINNNHKIIFINE